MMNKWLLTWFITHCCHCLSANFFILLFPCLSFSFSFTFSTFHVCAFSTFHFLHDTVYIISQFHTFFCKCSTERNSLHILFMGGFCQRKWLGQSPFSILRKIDLLNILEDVDLRERKSRDVELVWIDLGKNTQQNHRQNLKAQKIC